MSFLRGTKGLAPTQQARKFKKFQAKKLVKSSKSKIFFVKLKWIFSKNKEISF